MAVPTTLQSEDQSVSNEDPESEDLKKFRQEWLQELQTRGENSAIPTRIITPAVVPGPLSHTVQNKDHVTNVNESKETQNHALAWHGEVEVEDDLPPSLRKALGIYRRAVKHEQIGELDQALLLYRQAFKRDDKVDHAYQSIQDQQGDIESHMERSSIVFQPLNPIPTQNLVKITRAFPTNLKFEPENENEPVLLNKLPEEILVLIMCHLDPTSIERFAILSRKARLLSLDASIWRTLVLATYSPPQISDHDTLVAILEASLFDYRRVFIEQPRVRLDGIYIAVCQYVRPGLSENYWINVDHLITYHRYLRFFPNGQVLSLLANEGKSPQEVLTLLKPNLRMKGLFVGQWRLLETTVHLSNLIDTGSRSLISSQHQDPDPDSSYGRDHGHDTSTQMDTTRYSFEMTLNLRSKPLGRWNRMQIQTYNSLHLESGDIQPIALKRERPFWFSKVRSYM